MTMTARFETIPNTARHSTAEREKLMINPKFGTIFTDHMVTIRWRADRGWHDAAVRAREPFMLDPASAVLHYGQEIFEGMKAYRVDGDGITLFRPDENARRFAQSARRMAMPELPEQLFLEAVRQLVLIDRDWIPQDEGSLYLRPFMFANDAFLGMRVAVDYIFCVIACPVGDYFKGDTAISLWVSDSYSRAAEGGTGAAKCGGNYAGSLIAYSEAIAKGCDQVLFLDSATHRYVEELGGMNIFFVMADDVIVTPPLRGTILPGITRASLIDLAHDCGFTIVERPYAFEEWQADARSGRLTEAFACGTAAIVAGIGSVHSEDGVFVVGNGGTGPVTTRLRDTLIGIQRGCEEDRHGWLSRIG